MCTTASKRFNLISSAVLCLLVAAGTCPSSFAQTGGLSHQEIPLNRAMRAPLPETFQISQVATNEAAIWFLGFDTSVDPVVPRVYEWTVRGFRRLDLSSLLSGADAVSITGIHALNDGSAVLVTSDGLYSMEAGGLQKVANSKGTYRALAGRNSVWALSQDGDIQNAEAIHSLPAARKIAAPGPIDAWADTAAGDLLIACHTDTETKLIEVRQGSLEIRAIPLGMNNLPPASAVFSSSDGSLWIAFQNGSLARHREGGTDWFGRENGLPIRAINRIVEDRYGSLYFFYPQDDSEATRMIALPARDRLAGAPDFIDVELGKLKGPAQFAASDHLGGTWMSIASSGAYRLQGLGGLNWLRGMASESTVLNASSGSPALLRAAATGSRSAAAITGISAMPGGRLTNLNTSLGLVSNVVGCIVTDSKGNAYFGTGYENQGDDPASAGAGISKWDHRSMTSFGTAQGLPSNTVNACAYDPAQDRLWFGTGNGLVRMVPSTGAITSFLVGQKVQDIVINGGSVWVATFTNGIYRLDGSSGAQLEQVNAGNNKVTSLVFNNTGILFAGTSGSGLYTVNPTGASLMTPLGPSILVQDLEVDASNNVWISVWNQGVVRRTNAGAYTLFASNSGFGNSSNRAYRIERDSANNLWFSHGFAGEIGSPKVSLTFLPAGQVNSATPAFERYNAGNGLLVNTILGLHAETGSGLWLGVPGGGAFRIGGPFYAPGWPQALTGQNYFNSPLLVDLDDNKNLEVVVGDLAGWIHAFRPNGTVLWKFDTRAAYAGQTTGSMSVQSSVAAGDVDGDGEVDLVVGLGGQPVGGQVGQGGVLILSKQGVFKRVIYTLDTIGSTGLLEDGIREGVFATPVLANVDDDPELEIMAGAFDLLLYAWNGDGTPIYQNDEDGDGRFDEDFLGDATPYTPANTTDDFPGIRLVDDDGDGQVDEGGVNDDDEDGRFDEDYPEWPRLARDTVVASAAVFDFYGTGKNIIFGHDFTGGPGAEFNRGGVLRVFDRKGRNLPGFPKGNLEQVIWSSPVVADLDGDGAYEILHGTGLDLSTVGNAPADVLVGQLVYAWRRDGSSFKPGQNGRFATTEGASWASFAVGDIENDGSPELVIITNPLKNKANEYVDESGNVVPQAQARGQKLYAFRSDGSLLPGFPMRPNPQVPGTNVVGSPILVDVNSDNFLDIVVPVSAGLFVVDRTGQVLPGMGYSENLQDPAAYVEISSTPAVADIDLDGTLEIVWTVPGTNGVGSVVVAKVGTPNQSMTRSWPEWRRGANRNGVYGPLLGIVQGYESANNLNVYTQAFRGRAEIASVTVDASAVGGLATVALSDSGTNGDPVANDGRYGAILNVAGVAGGRYFLPVRVTDTTGQFDTQTLVFIKEAVGGRLSVSPASVTFGTVRQEDPQQAQLSLVNYGTAAVTIQSITSSNPEFTLAPGLTFPRQIAPGGVLNVLLRFRPGAAAGARSAILTINSTDSVTPVRTLTVTGAAASGAQPGCTYTLSPGQTLGVPYTGMSITFNVTTSAPNCAWEARSNQNWAQVFPLNGVGSSTISFNIFPNFSTRPRTAIANVSGSLYVAAQNTAIGSADERFVAQMYFAIFGRLASQAEIEFQVREGLGKGLTRAQLLRNFFSSEEFNNGGRYVAGVYVGLLDRNAEYGGWLFQRNALSTNVINQLQLVSGFLASPEYGLRFGIPTNQEYVRLLYRYILLREPAQTEVNFQVNALANISRTQLASNFLNSNEFKTGTGPRLTAFLLYALILQRDPTPEERALRESQIAGGADITALMAEILASSEFSGLIL